MVEGSSSPKVLFEGQISPENAPLTDVWAGYPLLKRIASCESWGDANKEPRQFLPDGSPVMKQVKARYVLGLTATPERKAGHHPIIYMQCGPIRHKLSARSMTAVTPFEHEVIARLTEFCLPPE